MALKRVNTVKFTIKKIVIMDLYLAVADPDLELRWFLLFLPKIRGVMPGKQIGDYTCEKNCPHFSGVRICSHTVVGVL